MSDTSIRDKISQAKAEVSKLSRNRNKLEQMILRLGPMLEGSFTKRYTRCKKPGCRCEKGERHGPYFSISKKDANDKTRLVYIRPTELATTSRLLETRREFRAGLKRLKIAQEKVDKALFALERLNLQEGEAQRMDLRKS